MFYRIYKFFLISIIVIMAVLAAMNCTLNSNIGRKYLISYIQKICIKHDINLHIESNENFNIKSTKNNWKLNIYGINFNHMCFLPPFNLKIDKIIFIKHSNNDISNNSSKTNNNVSERIKNSINNCTDQYKEYVKNNTELYKKINFFITKIFKHINIEQCIIEIEKKQYIINNTLYEFDYWNNIQIFNCAIENFINIHCIFDKLIKIDILGKDKYENYKAELLATYQNYYLKISDNKMPCFITLDGTINKNIKEVSSFHGIASYNNYKIDINGDIDFSKYLLRIHFDKVFDIIKNYITACKANLFDNINANIDINIDLLNFTNSSIITQFINDKLSNNILSELKITCNEKFDIFLNGNIDWLNIYGFSCSKINCSLKNKNINLKLFGKNFDFQTNATINNHLQINGAIFSAPKTNINLKGTIHDLQHMNIDINLLSSDLSIFNKIFFDIKGDIKGILQYKNNKLFGNLKSKQLSFNKYMFFNSKGEINDENFKINILQCNIFGKTCNNLEIFRNNNDIKLSLEFNQNEHFFCNFKKQNKQFFKKLFIVSGGIKKNELFFKFNKGELDYDNKTFNLEAIMLNTEINKQYGLVNIIYGLNEIKLQVNNLHIQKILDIFDKKYINGVLNIDTKLHCLGQDITGNIDCDFQDTTISKRHAHLNIVCNKNISEIKGTVFCNSQKLDLHANLPISVQKDCIKTHKFLQKLSIELKGKIDIKNLYEFKESVDLRGTVASDIKINGSFASPKINGHATIENVDCNIYGVLLKQGIIEIDSFNSDILHIKQACFADSQKHNLIINGIGKLFFDNFRPNIETNLNFIFKQYKLFDSDELTVTLSGNGKMTGPINKLFISGNVDVHDCTIFDILTNDIDIKDIQFIDKKAFYNKYAKPIYHKQDSISYDVSMKCKNIKLSGNIYNITMFGDLLLTTNNRKVSLYGNTKLKKGYIDFFGKRIPINSGIANFEKQYPFNPEAQFICNKNFGDISVKLKIINSPIKGGDIILSSIPYNTNDIILSKVLFGKEIQYLTFPEAAQLANAVHNIKNRGGLLSIMNSFKKIGIIDTISFSSKANQHMLSGYNDKNSINHQKTNISAGKYIGDNLFVSVNKNDDNVTLDLDYSLTHTISVKTNSVGETGISWKYRY